MRATSLSRNTVRKYLRTDKAEPPQYRRRAVPTKLTPFLEAVKMALLADARRPRKERRDAATPPPEESLQEHSWQGERLAVT